MKRLAAAADVSLSSVAAWRCGSNIPTLRVAIRVSESLEHPKLAEMVREARSGTCPRCGLSFLNEGGQPKINCSPSCTREAQRSHHAASSTAQTARDEALSLLGTELLRMGPIRKQSIGKALTLLRDEEERSPGLAARRRLPMYQDSVDAMCRACEPAGYCQTSDCPLRAVSPLPMLVPVDVAVATPAPGAWSPEHREQVLAGIRAANARRWSRPGERETASEQMRDWHASMSPEERADWHSRQKAGKARQDRSAASRKGAQTRRLKVA